MYNTGPLRINDTLFAENTAEDGGLAIQNAEAAVELWNVTFEENILSCPSEMYGDIGDVSTMIPLPTPMFTIQNTVGRKIEFIRLVSDIEFGRLCRQLTICISGTCFDA